MDKNILILKIVGPESRQCKEIILIDNVLLDLQIGVNVL